MDNIRQRDFRVAVIVFAVLLLGAGAFVAVAIASGLYNIGADAPHSRVVTFAIEQLRDRSTQMRSRDIKVPPLDNVQMISEGAEHYEAMCSGCHLAPGMTESEIRAGLYPQPPNLVVDGIDDPREAFWIVKHGIKMSGMPAWGKTHDDQALWSIVAFLKLMPSMKPEAYRAMAGADDAEP